MTTDDSKPTSYHDAIRAQAEGYCRIGMLVLRGDADRDPQRFVADVKLIMREQADKGA